MPYMIQSTHDTNQYLTRDDQWTQKPSRAWVFEQLGAADTVAQSYACKVVDAAHHLFYHVPSQGMPALQEQVAKLNKRCRKMKLDEIEIEVLGVHQELHQYLTQMDNVAWTDKPGDLPANCTVTGVVNTVLKVRIKGDAPVFEGYELSGVLEPVELAAGGYENMIRTVPGKTVPASYRTRVFECQHCNTKRRRKETFVVRHIASGKHVAVGRSCLKDFLGHCNPNQLARAAEYWCSLQDSLCEAEDRDFVSGGHVATEFQLEPLLGLTAGMINRYGWMPRSACENRAESTADRVAELMDPPKFGGRNAEAAKRAWRADLDHCVAHAKQPKVAERVKAAIEWASNLEIAEDGYLANLNLTVRMARLTKKDLGIACSLLAAYDRHLGNETKRKERDSYTNEHFGTVGEWIIRKVTLEKTTTIENEWGVSVLHSFRDADGRCFKWFSSGHGTIADPNETLTIRAKIKKHDNYKEQKQTVLQRVEEYVPSIELTDNMIVLCQAWTSERTYCTPLTGRTRYVIASDDSYNELKALAESLGGRGKAILKRLEKVEMV